MSKLTIISAYTPSSTVHVLLARGRKRVPRLWIENVPTGPQADAESLSSTRLAEAAAPGRSTPGSENTYFPTRWSRPWRRWRGQRKSCSVSRPYITSARTTIGPFWRGTRTSNEPGRRSRRAMENASAGCGVSIYSRLQGQCARGTSSCTRLSSPRLVAHSLIACTKRWRSANAPPRAVSLHGSRLRQRSGCAPLDYADHVTPIRGRAQSPQSISRRVLPHTTRES